MKVQPLAGVGCCAVRLMSARHPTPGTFLIVSTHGYQFYKTLLRVKHETDLLQDTDKSSHYAGSFFFFHLPFNMVSHQGEKPNSCQTQHNYRLWKCRVQREGESQWAGDLFRMWGHVRGAKMDQNSKTCKSMYTETQSADRSQTEHDSSQGFTPAPWVWMKHGTVFSHRHGLETGQEESRWYFSCCNL